MNRQNIRLYNGECIEVMKGIKDKTVDMVLCDLPYGTTVNKWDSIIPFDKLWEQYNRIVKDNGAILLFAQIPFATKLGASNLKDLRYEWIWKKDGATGFLNSKRAPMKNTENILVFYKKQPTYNPQGLIELKNPIKYKLNNGQNYRKATREYSVQRYTNYPKNLLSFNRDKDKVHPTQKPVALLEYLVRTYTNEGEVVLDNCMGSGSTGVACVKANRGFIGIERELDYFNIAKGRIEEQSKQNVI